MNIEKINNHVWALSGNYNNNECIDKSFRSYCEGITSLYIKKKTFGFNDLKQTRTKTMIGLISICEKRTELLHHCVFLCGGFFNTQVTPQHIWLEDRTLNKSFDTIIGSPVITRNKVGSFGYPFRPGSEPEPFHANEIARVRLDGFTKYQLESIELTIKVRH